MGAGTTFTKNMNITTKKRKYRFRIFAMAVLFENGDKVCDPDRDFDRTIRGMSKEGYEVVCVSPGFEERDPATRRHTLYYRVLGKLRDNFATPVDVTEQDVAINGNDVLVEKGEAAPPTEQPGIVQFAPPPNN